MNDDKMNENLDLLNLDEEVEMESLPEADLFAENPRPKKPWLLIGVGIGIFVLASFIIIGFMKSDSSSSIEVDLDGPSTVSVEMPEHMIVPDRPNVRTVQVVQQPAQQVQRVQTIQTVQPQQPVRAVPVREVQDRKNVMFNQNAGAAAKPVAQPAVKTAEPVQRQVVKTTTTTVKKPEPLKTTVKKTTTTPAASANWYVQLGSYSTKTSADNAAKKLQTKHQSLLKDKRIIVMSAVLPNGKTTHRLRVPFAKQVDAKGFCSNSKSDGLDCYVAK